MSNGHAAAELIRHSVTRDDHDAAAGGVFFVMLAGPLGTPARMPEYWSAERDFALAATVRMEAMWGSAIGKAITKQAALGWQVADTNDSELRTKRAQALLHLAEGGQGWVTFIGKHLRNFLTTDNGAFVEIVRASGAPGSKILGIMHLDSHRCTRTGDPERPVLYRDLKGAEHILRAHQVLMFADMPDPSESYRGVGYCAASRAWPTIKKLTGMETYVTDKLTGGRHTAIQLVSGISQKQLTAALATGDAQQQASGAVVYRGVLVVPGVDPSVPPQVATIPLAEVPDGFDAKQERDNAYVIYANAIGIPVQDIQPLSGQGLGTGTQTIILDEASEGMGLAAWRKQFEHLVNEYVLPETTTFAFSTNDIRDQKAKADVQSTRAATRKTMIESGEITAPEARQIAADAEDIPREFLVEDLTAGGTLSDSQKPIDADAPQAAVAAAVPVEAQPAIVTKAKARFAEVAALLDENADEAEALYHEVSHE
jgi:hypothetical protein